jgi:hypothetical protein
VSIPTHDDAGNPVPTPAEWFAPRPEDARAPERLFVVARHLAEMKTDDMDDLNRSVHMRDLKTAILRLIERIER